MKLDSSFSSLEPLLTAAQYASLTGRTVAAVAHERVRGGGCPYVKIGKKVFYQPSVIRAYLEKCQVSSTAQPVA